MNPEQCGGRPCVRGLRIRVMDVLDLLAAGLSPVQVIEELPDLELEDISACLRFASRRLDHPSWRREALAGQSTSTGVPIRQIPNRPIAQSAIGNP